MGNDSLAVDLNGALLRSRPFDVAHKSWFKVMSVLLNDDSVNSFAFREDYFVKVHEVMSRYLGDVSKESRVRFARNLFSMSVVGEVSEKDVVDDFVVFLRSLKKKFSLVLITSVPEFTARALLEKIGCSDLFDVIVESSISGEPDKLSLFEDFVEKHGVPSFYIGLGDKDLSRIKNLGIKTVSVNWVSKSKFEGDFDVDSVDDLRELF